MGIVPVTQRQFELVVGRNPASFGPKRGGSPEHPIESVSWFEAVAFCKKLSELPAERSAGRRYRLPTEAEWEHACRAGAATPYAHGIELTFEHAAFATDALRRTGQFAPNALGLYDMHGNVWEWCLDYYAHDWYQRGNGDDPRGPEEGVFRVLRGGSWRSQAFACRSSARHALPPTLRADDIGFRVVMEFRTK
jgi:formylglycine-generating enzyme required for sulfatase activity